MRWFQEVRAWVVRDWKRFAWELAAAGMLAAVGWFVGYWLNEGTLQACQDERTELLRQNAAGQAILDSVKFAGIIAGKDLVISKKDEAILVLQQKIKSDSIAHLSDLDAIWSINDYVENRKPSGR